MKKITIIAFMLAASVSAFAQTDSKTVKPAEPKPVYRANATAPVAFTVTLNLGQIDAFYAYAANPASFEQSKTLTGEQISAYRDNYKYVNAKIDSAMNASAKKALVADQLKFTADTTAKYHPKK